MATPIKGYEGTVTIADGAVGQLATWISSWEVSLETEEKTVGPFINDNGTLYTYTTSRKLKGKIEATIPSGRDAAQTLLVSGAMSGANLYFDLVTTNGYRIRTSGVASAFTMNQDASDSPKISFEFGSVGTFVVTPLQG